MDIKTRFLSILTISVLLLSLCSCGSSQTDNEELPPEAPKDDPVFADPSIPVQPVSPTIPDTVHPEDLDRSDGLPYKMAIVGEARGTSTTSEGFVDLMVFDDEHNMSFATYYTITMAVQIDHDAGFSLHAVHLVDKEGLDLFGSYLPVNYPYFAREYRSQLPTDEAIAARSDLFATGYPFFAPDECDTMLTVVLVGIEPLDLSEFAFSVEGVDYAKGEEVSWELTPNAMINSLNTTPRVIAGSGLIKIGNSYYLHNPNQLTGGDNGRTFFSRPLHLQNVTNPFQDAGDLDNISFAYFDLTSQDGITFKQVGLPDGASYLAEVKPSGTNYQDLWLGITCQEGQINQIRMTYLQKPGLYLIGDYPTILVNG